MDLVSFVKALHDRDFPVEWPGHWIGSSWLRPERVRPRFQSHNPNDGEPIISFDVDRATVARALDESYSMRAKTASLTREERLKILQGLRTTLVDYQAAFELCLRIEAGKPLWEAKLDFEAAIGFLDDAIQRGDSIFENLLAPARLGSQKGDFKLLPMGLTVAYLPFSTPITTLVSYFSSAIIAGCPLLLISSSHAVLSSMLFAYLTKSLDLRKNVLNIIFGPYDAFRTAISDERVAAVLYTGSREHCAKIQSEQRFRLGRQVVLQSGGKNAVIVHSSADIERAVKIVSYGALLSAGQRCTSTSRVFAYKGLLKDFCDALASEFQAIHTGATDEVNGKARAPDLGPLYSQKSVEKYLRFQTMASRESKVLIWGKEKSDTPGFFVTPSLHLIEEFDNSTAYQRNVLFSPDVAIYPYEVLEDAINKINTTDASFAVSFVGDPDIIKNRRRMFLAPNLLVNRPTVELGAHLPLAGRLQSGHHRFHGPGIALYLCYPQVVEEDIDDRWRRSWDAARK